MTTNIPLNQQVNAFLGKTNGAPPPMNGSPFGSVNPPEARAASPFGASVATAPTSSPFGQAAATTAPASVFGAAAQPAPAAQAPASSPFGAVAIGGQAPAAQAAPSAFGAFAAQPAVDPRLAECLPSIEPSQRVAWLAHCEQNGLDYKTGTPKQAAQVAVIPSTPAPATQEATDATYRGIAQRMYDEGRALAGTEHSETQRFYNAICTMNGPPRVAAPVGIQPNPAASVAMVPAAEPAKKARRKRSDAATASAGDEDESPQIVITQRAIVELITWLQSLAASAQ